MIFVRAAICVIVLCAAVSIQCIALRKRVRGWPNILDSIRSVDGRLTTLSHDEMFSEGLAIPAEDIYDHINKREGVRAMYHNTGVFMEVASELAAEPDPDEYVRRTRNRLYIAGMQARLLLLAPLASSYLGVTSPPLLISASVTRYVTLCARTCLAISDFYPHLLPQFRSHLIYGRKTT
jgi:hypothetical protein